jgi:hypothetical protein
MKLNSRAALLLQPGCLGKTRGFPSPPRDGFGLELLIRKNSTLSKRDLHAIMMPAASAQCRADNIL